MNRRPSPTGIREGSLRARLRRGVSWNTLGTIALQGAAFVVSVVVANLLGHDAFGQYSMILATILTLTGIAQVATGVTATRYLAEYRISNKLRAGRVLGLCTTATWITGLVAAGLLLLAAPRLAEQTLHAPHLTQGLMIGAIAVLFGAVNGFQSGALAGLEAYRALGIASTAQGALHILLCSTGALLFGLYGAVIGLSVSSIIRWIIFGRVLTHEAARLGITVSRTNIGEERSILWRFALPAAAGGLTTLPALWLAQTMLARQEGGYEELGLYAAANNLRVLVLFAPLILNNVGMALLNSQIGANNGMRYRRVFWVILVGTASTAIVGALAVGALGPWFLGLFGRAFQAGHTVLLILLASTIVEALAVSVYQIMQSHERMWLSFFVVSLPRDVLIVALAWMLTPTMGAVGLAVSYAAAWTVTLLVIASVGFRLGLNIPIAARRPG